MAHMLVEWLEKKIPYKNLHTNNGVIRDDAERRAGWNACREHILKQARKEKNHDLDNEQ